MTALATLDHSPIQGLRTPDLADLLHEVFGYSQFRGPQQAIIEHVSHGGDALVLMPTGGGKSLCYQLPAIARSRAGLGVALVVSPLIALMHDQVGALQELGVSADLLNSSLTAEQAHAVEQRLLRGDITLLYAAPERVTNPRFLALLDKLHARGALNLFAIDEAHCVSQWGHDFRPEYRALSVLHERFAGVPRVALTATADDLTRADIIERLQLQDARCYVSSFDRPNIHYCIVEKREPLAQLLRFIQREHTDDTGSDSGIVYCQSRKRVEEVALSLHQAGLLALPYHAGMDASTRRLHQDRFLREEGVVMVATIAFGMGIDKPDVRFVAHLDMPKNIEGYYQETGRAGRDGLPAQAWMCYGLQDVVNQRRMIDESPAADEHKQAMRGKLDALLALAEATDCRRVHLLRYFGETYAPEASAQTPLRLRCGHCDNCLQPPATWDATQAAQMLLSTVYRVHQISGTGFGVAHTMDIVRGKLTDKVQQHNHQRLSCYGVGSAYSESQLRSVMRQLVATGALGVDAQSFNTLYLTDASRPVLKGLTPVVLRQSSTASAARKTSRHTDAGGIPTMNHAAQARWAALKAWRFEVARTHNLPAYAIFHDATLQAIAIQTPSCLEDLQQISGIGQKKLQAYGQSVLDVVRALPS